MHTLSRYIVYFIQLAATAGIVKGVIIILKLPTHTYLDYIPIYLVYGWTEKCKRMPSEELMVLC